MILLAIIRLYDAETKRFYYLDWDLDKKYPNTVGMPLNAFKKYFLEITGDSPEARSLLNHKLKRVKESNISCYPPNDRLNLVLQGNKAGENGTYANYETLLDLYCRKKNSKALK